MVDINLKMVGRDRSIFHDDILTNEAFLTREISESKFLVIGGAGTIGQAVCKEIFMRNPRSLHVVDISENNLVELTRDLRSSQGYIDGDFNLTHGGPPGSFVYIDSITFYFINH